MNLGSEGGFPVVIDTNIVLDLLVFKDAGCTHLRQALAQGQRRWLASSAMRDELERVLGYPNLAPRLMQCQLSAQQVLAEFDQKSQLVAAAASARVRCTDPDDQIFVDLAVAHQALLLSKDQAVLALKKRLLDLGVVAQSMLPPLFEASP
ncbi:MAG: putative toxin-antitoxin system toxin component, PIN family [Burkholderiaceae bacterium]